MCTSSSAGMQLDGAAQSGEFSRPAYRGDPPLGIRHKRQRQRRVSSRVGRKRKPGERYPSGQLKPAGPSEDMLRHRQSLVAAGQEALATCPLDVALAHRWLTVPDHKAGVFFASLYRQADLGGPRLASGRLPEVEPSIEARDLSFAHMTDPEIAAIWDAVFSAAARGDQTAREEHAARAGRMWKAIAWSMPLQVRQEMHLVCIAEQFPRWMTVRLQSAMARQAITIQATAERRAVSEAELATIVRQLSQEDQRRRAALMEGLKIVRLGLWRRKIAAPIVSEPA